MVSSAEISQGWSVRVSGGCRRADVDVVVVVVVVVVVIMIVVAGPSGVVEVIVVVEVGLSCVVVV